LSLPLAGFLNISRFATDKAEIKANSEARKSRKRQDKKKKKNEIK